MTQSVVLLGLWGTVDCGSDMPWMSFPVLPTPLVKIPL